jgi:hypothetical protein
MAQGPRNGGVGLFMQGHWVYSDCFLFQGHLGVADNRHMYHSCSLDGILIPPHLSSDVKSMYLFEGSISYMYLLRLPNWPHERQHKVAVRQGPQ